MPKRSVALISVLMTFGGVAAAGGGAAPVGALPQAERPNILIIVVDDQRLGTLDVMPEVVDGFGARGTEYTNAFVTTPLCCPSRGSIFTGQYAHNHHVSANAGDAVQSLNQRTTLAYYLHRAGYRTGIFGKYFNPWPLDRKPPYFDRYAVTNFNYYDAKFNVQGRQRVVKEYSTDFISDRAAGFIGQGARSDQPWFLYVAPNATHSPFLPEKKYADAEVPPFHPDDAATEKDLSDKPAWVRSERIHPKYAAKVRRGQLRTLMSVDDMVGRLDRVLEETGQADNTLAIFVSDNGYFWGEHGLDDKRLPYLQSIRVPMFVRWPGHVAAGATDHRMVANIDIAPTVLEAAGVDAAHSIDGNSLLGIESRDGLLIEYFRDDAPFDRVPNWAGIHTSGYQYVEYYDGGGRQIFREYYDLTADPHQLVNLLGDGDPTNDPNEVQLRALSDRVKSGRNCSGATCP
jgi:arylsulfatase A-like enzyme